MGRAVLALKAPREHDWPSRTGISRYNFWIFLALATAIGATWSLADPVSQVSLYDWVRRLLLGVVQGASAGLLVHAVLWRFNQSARDSK
jgi:hypothetical protein